MLQRFAQLAEQLRVLDSDGRLGGKGLDQFDFLLGEWLNLRAHQGDDADRNAVAQQGHSEIRAILAHLLILDKGVFRIGQTIGQMYNLPLERRTADH